MNEFIQCSIKSKPTLALYFLLLFKMESRKGWGKKMDYAVAAVELCFMRWKNLIHLRVEKTFKPRFSVRVNSQIYYEQEKNSNSAFSVPHENPIQKCFFDK